MLQIGTSRELCCLNLIKAERQTLGACSREGSLSQTPAAHFTKHSLFHFFPLPLISLLSLRRDEQCTNPCVPSLSTRLINSWLFSINEEHSISVFHVFHHPSRTLQALISQQHNYPYRLDLWFPLWDVIWFGTAIMARCCGAGMEHVMSCRRWAIDEMSRGKLHD